MGFKMNGSPAKMGTISGTAGHSSALKQLVDVEKQKENMTKTTEARTKQGKGSGKKPYVKKGGKATGSMKDYALNTQGRRDEYDARGWAQDKTTEVAAKVDTKNITVTGGDGNKNAVVTRGKNQNASKITDSEKRSNRDVARYDKRTGEGVENDNKSTARANKKNAKKAFGKGSKKHLEAKQALLVAKEADRQGKSGGRKQGFFRKLSSKINKKKQAKNQAKMDKEASQGIA
jgi:hypothetical protein|tara:strand:+ start:1477 stop:2172 length:696 start_codon:yes stop_codon:yes gene_type:complete